MKLRMFGDNVLVEIIPHERTEAGVLIPETQTSQPPRFIVREVGPGYLLQDGTLVPPQFAVGDEVFCEGAADALIDADEGKKYALVHQNQVRCLVVERPKMFGSMESRPQDGPRIAIPNMMPNGKRGRLS